MFWKIFFFQGQIINAFSCLGFILLAVSHLGCLMHPSTEILLRLESFAKTCICSFPSVQLALRRVLRHGRICDLLHLGKTV